MKSTYTVNDFKRRWAAIRAECDKLVGPSLIDQIAEAERLEPGSVERILDQLGPARTMTLAYIREAWNRPKQRAIVENDAASRLVYIGGRGAGKTEVGGGWAGRRIERGAREIVFCGPTKGDIENYMIGGRKRRCDGLLGSSFIDQLHPWSKVEFRMKDDLPHILVSDRARVFIHSAILPEFRGPNVDTVWIDEPIKMRYPEALISNLELATRAIGAVEPQTLFTTSPKRLRFLRDLVMRPNTFVVHSFTWENLGNVSPRWYAEQVERLHGTQQGREEIDGELETDDGSEMFSLSVIDGQRRPMPTTFTRIGVAVDPSGNDKKRSDLAGIVAAGLVGNIHTGHGYMIEDASEKLSWDAWGHKTVVLAEERGASFILCETNKFSGGVSANIRTAAAARGYVATTRPGTKHQIDLVQGSRRIELLEVHSKDDKITRAGPVSTLYQRGRFHHVGHWFELEDEMSEFSVGSLAHGASPNRMDALVHCVTELFELNRAPEENFEEVNRGYAGLVQQMGGGEPKHSPAPSQTPSSGSLAHLFGMYPRRPV